jgi:putative Mn2+ efflux pump MntP
MIYEGVRQGSTLEAKPLTIYVLLILSTATSIDALAVGLSLTFLKVQIAAPNKIDWQ